MKNKLIFLLIFSVLIILGISLFTNMNHTSLIKSDINKEVIVDDKKLDITYYESNMIDEDISYGNIFTKIIKVSNKNNEKVNFAVHMEEQVLSNQSITYNVRISREKDRNYTEVLSDSLLTGDNLAYNLTIDENSDLYVKINFVSKKENESINIKGELSIVSNLSKSEVFLVDVNSIQNEILTKINSINGINEKGVYYYEVNGKLNGVVIIDANDISELFYYYFVYSNDLVLYNIEYSKISNKISNDISLINNISTVNACNKHSKNGCVDLNTLSRNENGGRNNFYNDVIKIINEVKEVNKDKKDVIVYDIKNDISNSTNIRGYILADNSSKEPVYFLYLTNDLFMISGYNLIKNGMFKSDSTAIRAYNETAFRLSSENASKVCMFSGYADCVNAKGEKV